MVPVEVYFFRIFSVFPQTILKVNVGDPIALGVKKIPKDFKEGVLDKARKVPGAVI